MPEDITEETPCFCPRCEHDHVCPLPPAEGERRLADGRLARLCVACMVQCLYETKKGANT